MKNKKISIIGNGTAGCLAVSTISKFTDCEIDWYYDSSKSPLSVGEGSLINFPLTLLATIDFNYDDLQSIDGTVKLGIRKLNWANGNNFDENFFPGRIGYHFNANKLQNLIFDRVKKNKKVKIIDKNISNFDDIDSEKILSCRGFPKSFDEYTVSEYIPVNSSFVTKCYWDYPKFNHTLTIARPHGWVFCIPLKNRCAVGYLYNKEITSLELIKEDVKNIFYEYNLTPSDETLLLPFNNYYRNVNFHERVSFCGNESFFLEPLEATSLQFTHEIVGEWFKYITNQKDLNECNNYYSSRIKEIENIIMMHYFSGSIFDSNFWKFAKDKGERNISCLKNNDNFKYLLNHIKTNELELNESMFDYGTWDEHILKRNLINLNIIDKL